MRALLERNNLCKNDTQHFVSTTVQNCKDFMAFSTPLPSNKVSISPLSGYFNQVVVVDHFYLDSVHQVNFRYTNYRYSGFHISHTATISAATIGSYSCWLNRFWPLQCLHGDKAFSAPEFKIVYLNLKFNFTWHYQADIQKIHSSENMV